MRNYQLLAIGYKQTEVFRGRVHNVQNPRRYLRSGATRGYACSSVKPEFCCVGANCYYKGKHKTYKPIRHIRPCTAICGFACGLQYYNFQHCFTVQYIWKYSQAVKKYKTNSSGLIKKLQACTVGFIQTTHTNHFVHMNIFIIIISHSLVSGNSLQSKGKISQGLLPTNVITIMSEII